MGNLYNTALLPNQQAINSIAILYHDFESNNANFNNLLSELKLTMSRSDFMRNQNHNHWFYAHGSDYTANPKLFSYAPLNVICAYLSEIFKHKTIEQMSDSLAIKAALLRLRDFMVEAPESRSAQ